MESQSPSPAPPPLPPPTKAFPKLLWFWGAELSRGANRHLLQRDTRTVLARGLAEAEFTSLCVTPPEYRVDSLEYMQPPRVQATWSSCPPLSAQHTDCMLYLHLRLLSNVLPYSITYSSIFPTAKLRISKSYNKRALQAHLRSL